MLRSRYVFLSLLIHGIILLLFFSLVSFCKSFANPKPVVIALDLQGVGSITAKNSGGIGKSGKKGKKKKHRGIQKKAKKLNKVTKKRSSIKRVLRKKKTKKSNLKKEKPKQEKTKVVKRKKNLAKEKLKPVKNIKPIKRLLNEKLANSKNFPEQESFSKKELKDSQVLTRENKEKGGGSGRGNKGNNSGKGSKEGLGRSFLKSKLSIISAILRENLKYPFIARKMGWEGKVVISFILTKDGKVKNIKVVKSSGFSVLDENTIDTVKRCAHLFPLPPVDVKVVLPVVYRLE